MLPPEREKMDYRYDFMVVGAADFTPKDLRPAYERHIFSTCRESIRTDYHHNYNLPSFIVGNRLWPAQIFSAVSLAG
jgi:hypothetical protein